MNRTSRKPFAKTSISLPGPLWAFAQARADAEGFNSVSAYIADLIRRDREAQGLNSPNVAALGHAAAAAALSEVAGESKPPPSPGGKQSSPAHSGKAKRKRGK